MQNLQMKNMPSNITLEKNTMIFLLLSQSSVLPIAVRVHQAAGWVQRQQQEQRQNENRLVPLSGATWRRRSVDLQTRRSEPRARHLFI